MPTLPRRPIALGGTCPHTPTYHVVPHVFARLPNGQPIPPNDVGRMNLVRHQVVGALEQLRGEDHDGRRAVTNLLVLLLRELREDARRRVLHLQEPHNRGAIIGNGHVANLVDEHLVQALRAEARPQDVGDRHASGHVGGAHILAALPMATDGKRRHRVRCRAWWQRVGIGSGVTRPRRGGRGRDGGRGAPTPTRASTAPRTVLTGLLCLNLQQNSLIQAKPEQHGLCVLTAGSYAC